jgi:hypothetical protein
MMTQYPNIPQLIYSLLQYFDLPVERLPAYIWLLLQLLPVVLGLGAILVTGVVCGLTLLIWCLRDRPNELLLAEGQR